MSDEKLNDSLLEIIGRFESLILWAATAVCVYWCYLALGELP